MSMSDARQFAELSARVAELENRMGVVIAQIALAQAEIHDHVEGKDLHDEGLGPVADEVARDGLRAMLKERRTGIALEADTLSPGLLEGAGGDRKPDVSEAPSGVRPGAGEPDLPADPGLKDRLAALQGGEAAPSKPGMKK